MFEFLPADHLGELLLGQPAVPVPVIAVKHRAHLNSQQSGKPAAVLITCFSVSLVVVFSISRFVMNPSLFLNIPNNSFQVKFFLLVHYVEGHLCPLLRAGAELHLARPAGNPVHRRKQILDCCNL